MKKVLVVVIGMILLAGCSKKYNSDLTGTWIVYKVTYLNANDSPETDSLRHYTITFASSGQYVENDTVPILGGGADTLINAGTWAFQNSYGQLVLTDTPSAKRVYTVFDLTGNSVELLKDGYNRYMRKIQ